VLYLIFTPMTDLFIGFNLFRYPTFRAAFGAITAFLVCVVLGPDIIRGLRRIGFGEVVATGSGDLDENMSKKNGTPTMGGLLIILAILVAVLLFGRLDSLYTQLCLWTVLALGTVGAWDDWLKTTGRTKRGMSMRTKLVLQLVITLVVVSILYTRVRGVPGLLGLQFPVFKDWIVDLGLFYLVSSTLVIVGSSNAVNLTDGLDGLAVGCVAMVGLTFCAVAYVVSQSDLCAFLRVTHVPGSEELMVFCAILVGACLGFLWFNGYPATVFMGDTGSLALGGALGLVAVMARAEFQFLVAGGVFVAEAASVIIQVLVYKRSKRRFFLCAPFHHHLQFKGWHEMKVVVRLWIVMAILGLTSLAMFKLR
jgi:phospho-N-acetylmuramoyl-pentapeptide-transferase